MTYREAINLGEKVLNMADVADAKIDAWLLLEMVCKIDRSFYYLHMEDEVAEEQLSEYEIALRKRAEHVPLQYIVGEAEFMGLKFKVNSNVLIPRQDTETLVEEALKVVKPGMKVLDLCTGSGCIIVSIVHNVPEVEGTATDISKQALLVAKENAKLNHLEDSVTFICKDVFDLLPELEEQGEKFDVVILDPPAFTKSRNSIKNAVKGYREINLRAMKLVKDGGFLATCSCSHFMDYELFTKTIGQAASNSHKRLRQVEFRTQAPDHPILWAADESYYLKFYIFQVTSDK